MEKNNLGNNSISIVLSKIDAELIEQDISESHVNESSIIDFDNKEDQLLINGNQNKIILDDITKSEISKLNLDLQIKPQHWTEEYWQQILLKYMWFMHKDSYIGCKICYNIKVFMGKRSLLGTMKLFLMDLSYEDLELKLSAHNLSVQHNKSIILFRAQIGMPEVIQPKLPSTPIMKILRKSRPIDHHCPLCSKGYKIKKALAKHIYSCNNEQNNLHFSLPCSCLEAKVASIRAIDEHNIKTHSNRLLYVCKFCFSEFKQATVLFGHLLLFHDFYWNPYEELPEFIEKSQLEDDSNKTTNANRPDRKKSIANSMLNDIYIMYGAKDNLTFATKTKEITHIKRPYRRHFKEKLHTSDTPTSDIRIERVKDEKNNQEISKLTISQSSIFTCEYCGGRYLSMGILDSHMANYHMIVPKKEQENKEKRRQRCIKRFNKLIKRTNFNFQINKQAPKSTYIRLSSHMRKVRALQMKKKFNLTENISKISEEILKKIKQKDFKSMIAKRNKVSASMLTCPACQISFLTLELRLKHVSENHPELEKFCCEVCGLIFTNQKTYQQHVEKSHNSMPKQPRIVSEKTYSCDNCHLVFTNQADLTCHLNLSHPDLREIQLLDNNNLKTIQNCDLDDFETVENETINELDTLIQANAEENLSPCTSCKAVLHNHFELLIHNFTHNENGKQIEEFQSCPHCSRMFFGKNNKIYLKDHYNSEHLKKGLPQCGKCKLTLSSSVVLEIHQQDKNCQNIQLEDPYSPFMSIEKLAFCCSQCGLIFAGQNSKQRFDIHMKNCTFELMDNDLMDS